jgi:glycosyltransferase involved in cell wall biosynthesis
MRRELTRRPIDCVITSSPAESTHLLALGSGTRRPPWIADFRDGWCFEPIRPPFPLAAQRALDHALERRVVISADVVVAVTPPIVDDFRSRFGVAALHIPNGFDPELADAGPLPVERALTFVHTGALFGIRGRDPGPLLSAIQGLLRHEPGLEERLELLVVGRSEHDERSMIESAGLSRVVRHLGYVPRTRALSLQRAADALILLTSPGRCEATGKLYEYLGSRRPIIALAEGSEAGRIVSATGTGTVVRQDDVPGITAALRDAISGELESRYAPHGLEPYTYPAPAEQMAEAVEAAIEAHSARARS